MRTLLLIALTLVPSAFPEKKNPPPRPAVIEVVEATAHREENTLNIDGKLRNIGERPAEDLVVIVDILDSDKQPLTTVKGESDPETIEPTHEGEFHAQIPAPPRAVYFRLSFEDGTKHDLKAVKPGPFAIE